MKYSSILVAVIIFAGCSAKEPAITALHNPASANARYPFLYSEGNELYMSWLAYRPDSKTYVLNYARYSGKDWSDIRTIAAGRSWFVNWADFPSLIAGGDGLLAAHWLDKIPGGTYAYNVNIALKNASGQWTAPVIPHADSTATEHGFVSMIPWNENSILAVWLDGRQSANDKPKEYYDISNAMTLRAALISTTGEILERFLIDDSVCDCCQTSLIKTSGGALVAYRNRTQNEIRDIYVSRFNGEKWSKPEAVFHDNWNISACPVNGPKLAAANSMVVAAWPTAIDKDLTVKASLSFDNGKTFKEPRIISEGVAIGRVDAAIHNNTIFISWMKQAENGALLQLTRFTPGMSTKTITVSAINASRKTGFPQLEVWNGNLIMAWTAVDSLSTQIKTVQIDI